MESASGSELEYSITRNPDGSVLLTLSSWLATEALPIALRNRAEWYRWAAMPFIENALVGLARELKHSKREGIIIDG